MSKKVWYTNGCKLIDLVTGGAKGQYGYPAGRIINICGDKSTGKTFLCNEIIANAHYKYGDKFKWMYADCERGYSFDTQNLYGFDIHDENSDAPENVEQAYYCIRKFAENLEDDEFGVYVLDSLDALTSDEQDKRADERVATMDKGKEFDKGSYGMGKAKYLSQEFFPQLCKILENKNILLIIVSQIRDNTDMFSFEKYSRSGGKALDFYCYMVIWLATAKKMTIEKGEQKATIGGTNKLKVTKGKVPRPFRECFYTYLYDYGIDSIATGVDYLFDVRTKTGDISAPVAKCCAWEQDPNKKPISGPEVRQWLIDNKWFKGEGGYKEFVGDDAKFALDTAIQYINNDPEKKELFDNTFSVAMDRDSLIKYIEENSLEDELNRRVEEKWEAFEDSLASGRKRKYSAQVPTSTDEDVII
ncbi:MAG: hypothetical protein J6Y78_09525 [Paludibacteraceae bacterium]|nr:hypothetical protein [Paludibacteraceae bacterium]